MRARTVQTAQVISALKRVVYKTTPLIPWMIGILLFLLIIGSSVLNPKNVSWLYYSRDTLQSYLGWSFFYHDQWRFPLGLNPTYGLEIGSSIVYTDSIPLLAILFKLWSPYSGFFQYFGIWICLCFILQSWLGWKLSSLYTDNIFIKICCSILFVLSPPMLWRIGQHTALVSHFLILASLFLSLQKSIRYPYLCWILLILTSCLVHFYIFIMVVLIWLASLLDSLLVQRNITYRQSSAYIILLALLTALVCWQGGYFVLSPAGVASDGFGIYRFNLFAFIDSGSHRTWLDGRPINNWSSLIITPSSLTNTNPESFSYLGLGLIILSLFSIYSIMFGNKILLAPLVKAHPFFLTCIALLFLYSLSNNLSINNWPIQYSLPQWTTAITGSLRSSARFSWPLYYFIIILIFYCVIKTYHPRMAALLVGTCTLLQISDIYPGLAFIKNQHKPREIAPFSATLKSPFWETAANHYKSLVVRPLQQTPGQFFWPVFGSYANQYHLSTDSVMIARASALKIDKINKNFEVEKRLGKFNAEYLYILDDWNLNQSEPKINPNIDLLARVDGFNILAPGWKLCKTCLTPPDLNELNQLAPSALINQPIWLSSNNSNTKFFLISGWGAYENWGTWSTSQQVTLRLPLPNAQAHYLELHTRALIAKNASRQRVSIFVNGQFAKEIVLNKSENNRILIHLPQNLESQRFLDIEMQLPDSTSPNALGLGADTRNLAIGLISATFRN